MRAWQHETVGDLLDLAHYYETRIARSRSRLARAWWRHAWRGVTRDLNAEMGRLARRERAAS